MVYMTLQIGFWGKNQWHMNFRKLKFHKSNKKSKGWIKNEKRQVTDVSRILKPKEQKNRVFLLSHSDKKDPQLRLRVLFCAGAGRIRTGRPSADGKKQFCGLFFRPRLANPPAPTKKLWQNIAAAFFVAFGMLDFPAAGDRGAVHAHHVKSETGHRIAAGTCNPGGKQV